MDPRPRGRCRRANECNRDPRGDPCGRRNGCRAATDSRARPRRTEIHAATMVDGSVAIAGSASVATIGANAVAPPPCNSPSAEGDMVGPSRIEREHRDKPQRVRDNLVAPQHRGLSLAHRYAQNRDPLLARPLACGQTRRDRVGQIDHFNRGRRIRRCSARRISTGSGRRRCTPTSRSSHQQRNERSVPATRPRARQLATRHKNAVSAANPGRLLRAPAVPGRRNSLGKRHHGQVQRTGVGPREHNANCARPRDRAVPHPSSR